MKKTRIIAAAFAAVMMMTTAASIAASANNAQVVKKMSVSSAMDNMTAEQKSRIEPKYLSKICDNQQFITNKINQLKEIA